LSYSDFTTLKLNYNDDTLLGKLSNVLDNGEETLNLICILYRINRSIPVFKTKTNWTQLGKSRWRIRGLAL